MNFWIKVQRSEFYRDLFQRNFHLVEHVNGISNAANQCSRADDVFDLLKCCHLMLVQRCLMSNLNSRLVLINNIVRHVHKNSRFLERPLNLFFGETFASEKITLLDQRTSCHFWVVEKVYCCYNLNEIENLDFLQIRCFNDTYSSFAWTFHGRVT